MDALIAFFAAYALDGFSITDAGETLFSLTETATHVTLEFAGATLELTGSFLEGNIGGYLAALTSLEEWLSAPVDERPATFGLNDFPGLDLTAITLTDMNGLVLFEMAGDFAGLERDPNGELTDPTAAELHVITEGTEGDDDFDLLDLTSDLGVLSQTVNLNGGHDDLYIDSFFLRAFSSPETVIHGGDGFDTLFVEDWGPTGSDLEFDFDLGELWGWDDVGFPDFVIDFTGIERFAVYKQNGDVLVLGDDNDNQVDIYGLGGFFEFYAGGGHDTILMDDIEWFDGVDWQEGHTLTELLDFYDFTLNPDGTIDIFLAIDSTHLGTIQDVEEIRLLTDDLTDSVDVSVPGILGLIGLDGTDGNDSLVGDSADTWIRGYAGDDSLLGGDGDDYLFGGAGNDVMTPGAGSDLASGGDGDDIFHHTSNPGDSDEYYGGDGQDRLVIDLTDVEDPTSFIAEIDLVSGDMGARGATDGRDIVWDIEEVELLGDVAADIFGGFESNLFLTGGGDDTVWGGGGDDTVNTGAGDDEVFADAGSNVLDGGDGIDLLDFLDVTSEWTVVDMPGGTIQGLAGLDRGCGVLHHHFRELRGLRPAR